MKMIAVLATGIIAMSGSAWASGLEQPARDFSGDYGMAGKGSGPRDSAYVGTCRISAADQGYDISCFNADTRHTYVGKGLAQGDTLAIFIGDTLRGDHNSVFTGEYLVLYRVRADGVLEGTWVHAGSTAGGAETLTPAR
ncbi:MAG: hypothetical protein A3D94_14995 [Alphaproteobacteria bacterium RIFCSPHIGHO2_12_FULL_66_14]|nr:MAG: hypothetical protein A3D94_14995 [Alphaproteobacteria bacterium RIFCSPHIGHO2_12_FULL_66_14]